VYRLNYREYNTLLTRCEANYLVIVKRYDDAVNIDRAVQGASDYSILPLRQVIVAQSLRQLETTKATVKS